MIFNHTVFGIDFYKFNNTSNLKLKNIENKKGGGNTKAADFVAVYFCADSLNQTSLIQPTSKEEPNNAELK